MHKAIPVTLAMPEEVEIWMTAPADEALKLQRPLRNGSFKIVARGEKGRWGMIRRMWRDFVIATPFLPLVLYSLALVFPIFFLLTLVINDGLAVFIAFLPYGYAYTSWQIGDYDKLRERLKQERSDKRNELTVAHNEKKDGA